MNFLDLNLQIQCKKRKSIPSLQNMYFWIKTIIDDFFKNSKVNIGLQIVREKKIKYFNKMYLKHDYVTNIIAFRYNDFLNDNYLLLGDLVICHDILLKESAQFDQPILKYYAYIIIHGVLHLINFHHKKKIEKEFMQSFEEIYLKNI